MPWIKNDEQSHTQPDVLGPVLGDHGHLLSMVAWSLPTIATEAGGLMPFDLRPTVYTPEEARAFLSALSVEGAEFYRGVQHRLDLF